jgi:cell division protein ZapA
MSKKNNERVSVTVQVMDKPFTLSCSVEERPALLDSANLLNEEMRKLKPATGNPDYEKIAVVSALNLADELLKLRVSSQEPPRSALSAEVVAEAQATLKAVAEHQRK